MSTPQAASSLEQDTLTLCLCSDSDRCPQRDLQTRVEWEGQCTFFAHLLPPPYSHLLPQGAGEGVVVSGPASLRVQELEASGPGS